VVDGSGHVLVANYGGGSVASLPIRADGGVEAASSFVQHAGTVADPKRQKGPHGHMIETDKANRFALAADLGLDQILVYRFDAKSGSLTPAQPPYASVAPRSGPRHFAFSPDGSDVYVLNEINVTVTAFKTRTAASPNIRRCPRCRGRNRPPQTGAEILVHPSGRCYSRSAARQHRGARARRHRPPRWWSTSRPAERLRAASGSTPAGGGCVGTAPVRWSSAIDPKTGRLTPTGQTAEVGAPVSVTFRASPSR
jgi:6-phosphogluconolactonase